MSAEPQPRACPKCGKASDPRSKKHGHCRYHMEEASSAYKCMIARQCEARDARHADYQASVERLHRFMRKHGLTRLELAPKTGGFACYLEKHGGAGERGVLQLVKLEDMDV